MAELLWPQGEVPRILAAGRYPLADRAHETLYSHAGLVAFHLHEVNGVLRREGRDEPFHPGELLVSFPHQATSYAHERPQRLWCIHCAPPQTATAPVPIPSTVVLGAQRDYVVERMARISRLNASAPRDPLSGAMAGVVMLEFLLTLSDIAHRRHSATQHSHEVEVAAAASWIESHATHSISIPALAQRVGLHQHTLARHFRQRFGHTMQGYQLACRLNQARNLLEHSDIPIHALARQLGFTDVQHFSKHFRRHQGLAPQRYRRHAVRTA